MKRLGLLRHAKSGWDDVSLDDFDRPLNERGRKVAIRMGEEFGELGLGFDLALVSPARRAADTFALVREGWQADLDVRAERRLYGASVEELLDLIAETPAHVERLLLVGHNPGLQQLAARLGGTSFSSDAGPPAARLPSGSLVEIALQTQGWEQLAQAEGRLLRFLRPRDLD